MMSSEIMTTDALVDEALATGEGLGRPLRYVQINSFYNGSTGTIMRNLHSALMDRGVDSYIFWGRRHETINDHELCCATKLGVYSHGMRTRLFGKAGFYSKHDTKHLLVKLDEIEPDIIHLHNIHGYYLNVEMLFEWLMQHEKVQVKWTLHDCWAFTGHCAYFTFVKCAQWKEHCAYSKQCPQLSAYPKTISKGSCAWNYKHKKAAFTRLPARRMRLITPSRWLEDLVKDSFLSKYAIEVRHNTIDKTIFKPTTSSFRENHGVGSRFMILGVASPWSERKGLMDFYELWRKLDHKRYAIVLVGLNNKQIKSLPEGIIGLKRTNSPNELAAIYTTADVFFNPTQEDNYPTVNLEAEACGTPVITYNTGGCAETLHDTASAAIVPDVLDALDKLTKLSIVQGVSNG